MSTMSSSLRNAIKTGAAAFVLGTAVLAVTPTTASAFAMGGFGHMGGMGGGFGHMGGTGGFGRMGSVGHTAPMNGLGHTGSMGGGLGHTATSSHSFSSMSRSEHANFGRRSQPRDASRTASSSADKTDRSTAARATSDRTTSHKSDETVGRTDRTATASHDRGSATSTTDARTHDRLADGKSSDGREHDGHLDGGRFDGGHFDGARFGGGRSDYVPGTIYVDNSPGFVQPNQVVADGQPHRKYTKEFPGNNLRETYEDDTVTKSRVVRPADRAHDREALLRRQQQCGPAGVLRSAGRPRDPRERIRPEDLQAEAHHLL